MCSLKETETTIYLVSFIWVKARHSRKCFTYEKCELNRVFAMWQNLPTSNVNQLLPTWNIFENRCYIYTHAKNFAYAAVKALRTADELV